MSQSPSYPFDLLIGRKGLMWKGPALLFGTIACTSIIMALGTQLLFFRTGIRISGIFFTLFYVALECGVCVMAAPKLYMLSKWQLSLFIGCAYSVVVWGISMLSIHEPIGTSILNTFLPVLIATTLFFYLMFQFYRGGTYACIAAAFVFLFSEFARIPLLWFFGSFSNYYYAYTGKQFLYTLESKLIAAAVFALIFALLQKVLKVQTGAVQVSYSFTPQKRVWVKIVLAVVIIVIGVNGGGLPEIISLPILNANQMVAIGFGFLLFVIYKNVKCYHAGNVKPTTAVNGSLEMPVRFTSGIRSNNVSDSSYMEKDNQGVRQDTCDKAKAYWISQNVNHKSDPFLLYTFKNRSNAESALLELSFIHWAADTGNLICREALVFGFYETTDGTIEAIVAGCDLSKNIWDAARVSFINHGGMKKNELAPEGIAPMGHSRIDAPS